LLVKVYPAPKEARGCIFCNDERLVAMRDDSIDACESSLRLVFFSISQEDFVMMVLHIDLCCNTAQDVLVGTVDEERMTRSCSLLIRLLILWQWWTLLLLRR
jgi:hypothetical protein